MAKTKITLSLTLSFLLIFSLGAEGFSPRKEGRVDFFSKKTESKRDFSGGEFREGEVIVKYKEKKIDLKKESGRKKAFSFEKNSELEEVENIPDLNLKLLKTRSGKSVSELVEKLKDDPEIDFVEPNYLKKPFFLPDDPLFANQWGLKNTGQTLNVGGENYSGTAGADISAEQAWEKEDDSFSETVVAVIDTGARHSHQDLSANMWDGSFCKDENNSDIAGGCPYHGWNFKEGNSDPGDAEFIFEEDDISGHGTLVAGVAAAVSGNGLGISGVSRKNKIKIMALRFGMDTISEVKAINFAKNNGAKIINASYGGSSSQSEREAIEAFGGLVVAAAGNEEASAESEPNYPCSYDLPNVICVASTDQNDNLSSFSNFGAVSVDLGAPGENILATYKNSDSSYAYVSGTSVSTAFVSGAAALLLSFSPSASPAEIKNALFQGDSLPSLAGKTLSERRLNLEKSLDFFSEQSFEPENPSPGSPEILPAVLSGEPSVSLKSEKKEKKKFSDWFRSKEKISFRGSLTELSGGKVVIRDKQGRTMKETSIDWKGDWKIKLSLKESQEIILAYFDSNGFEVKAQSRKIKVDGEKPKFKEIPPILTKRRGEEVFWKASDNKGISHYRYSIGGKKYTSKKSGFKVPAGLSPGLYPVQARAYDKAGNRATAFFVVRVR